MGYLMPLGFLVAGIVLVVIEMATVTFYLMAAAFAALVTALLSWLVPMEWWQAALVFAVAAVIAVPIAHRLRHRMQGSKADSLMDMDKGGLVTIAEDDNGLLKVKYRDSLWEATWEGAGKPQVGQHAEIMARDGARLRIKPIS